MVKSPRARAASDSNGGGSSFPRGLIVAWGVVVAVGVSGGVALSFASEDAVKEWRAGIPKVTVKVAAAAAMPVPIPPRTPPAQAPKPPPAAEAHPPQPVAPPRAEEKPHDESAAPVPPPAPTALPDPTDATPLSPAPAPGLVEDSRGGPLPRVGAEGRGPFQVYARPFPAGIKRPKIAVVLAEMGVSGVTTNTAMDKLPAAIDFAFAPHADRVDGWIERARSSGHEVMLSLAMEPIDYPRTDPGPNALFTILKPDRNVERLRLQLGKAVGYVGVVTTSGGKFLTDAKSLRPVIDELRSRGLLFLDPKLTLDGTGAATGREAHAITGAVDRLIDTDLSRGAIDDQLKGLESDAKAHGQAIGLGFPYPSTIERLASWATGLADRGFVLAPVSAVVPFDEKTEMPAPVAAAPEAPAAPAAGGHAAPMKGH